MQNFPKILNSKELSIVKIKLENVSQSRNVVEKETRNQMKKLWNCEPDEICDQVCKLFSDWTFFFQFCLQIGQEGIVCRLVIC